jgi:hypothetical protein
VRPCKPGAKFWIHKIVTKHKLRGHLAGRRRCYPHARDFGREFASLVISAISYVTNSSSEGETHPEWTEAIREHNRLITQDERYVSTIVPTRDGVMVALRVA